MSIHIKTEHQLFELVCTAFNLPLASRAGIKLMLMQEAEEQASNLRTILVDIAEDQETYLQEGLSVGGNKKQRGQQKQRNQNKLSSVPTTTAHTTKTATATTVIRPEWTVNSASMAKKQVVPIRHRDDTTPDKERIPTVYYAPGVLEKIKYIVAECKTEIGWWGPVERTPEGDFLIKDIFVPRQEVSGTETLISEESMVAMFMEYAAQGGDTDELYYWGHSHVNMAVSPSGQDETQVQKFLSGCKYFIREIRNKADAVKMDVYDRDARTAYLNVDYMYYPSEWETNMAELMKANVVKAVYTPPATANHNYGGYNNYNR